MREQQGSGPGGPCPSIPNPWQQIAGDKPHLCPTPLPQPAYAPKARQCWGAAGGSRAGRGSAGAMNYSGNEDNCWSPRFYSLSCRSRIWAVGRAGDRKGVPGTTAGPVSSELSPWGCLSEAGQDPRHLSPAEEPPQHLGGAPAPNPCSWGSWVPCWDLVG